MYAGFWRRFVALLIDSINVASVVGWFLYYALMESSSHQATIGKIALGIQVTDLAGNRISFGRALGRNLAKLISAIIFHIGFILAAFTERKQAPHDMIAGTLVVKREEQPAARPEPLEAAA